MPSALVDVSPELLADAQALTGLDESVSFSHLEIALATVQADAVIICTPTAFHAPLARLAFDAGKHVLVEKGMTTNWQDAVGLVAEAERAGVKFCVSQNYRYRPEVLTLKSAIDSGDARYAASDRPGPPPLPAHAPHAGLSLCHGLGHERAPSG